MRVLRWLIAASPASFALAVVSGLLSGGGGAVWLSVLRDLLAEPIRPAPMLWMLLAVICGVALTRWLSMMALVRQVEDVSAILRERLSRGALGTPLQELERQGIPRLMATVTQDLPSLAQLSLAVPELCISAAALLGYSVFLVTLPWKVVVLTLGSVMLGLTVTQVFLRRVFALASASRNAEDTLHQLLGDVTGGFKELRLHRPRRDELRQRALGEVALLVEQRQISTSFSNTTAGLSGQASLYLLLGALLFLPSTFTGMEGEVVSSAVLAVICLFGPLATILDHFQPLAQAQVALLRLDHLWESVAPAGSPSAAEEALQENAPPAAFRRLELRGVTYVHPGPMGQFGVPQFFPGGATRFELGPLDLTLSPGEILFVVGGNGSGKSTLGHLLTGLFHPTSGEVWLDGEALSADQLERLRSLWSSVFSNFHLFGRLHGVWRGPSDDTRIQAWLQSFRLAGLVKVEDGAFSTVNLSRGQRKRLALLVTLLEDRPLILFDEWAADQDTYFKEYFYRVLVPELARKGKAVVVISHDDRYFSLAHRILKLDHGKVELPQA